MQAQHIHVQLQITAHSISQHTGSTLAEETIMVSTGTAAGLGTVRDGTLPRLDRAKVGGEAEQF